MEPFDRFKKNNKCTVILRLHFVMWRHLFNNITLLSQYNFRSFEHLVLSTFLSKYALYSDITKPETILFYKYFFYKILTTKIAISNNFLSNKQ